jgi:hypothetical protein
MSLGEYNLDEVTDPELLEDDEYELRCVKAIAKIGKDSGLPYIALQLLCDVEPDAETIFHNIILPHSEREERANKFLSRLLKRAVQAFGIDFGADITEFEGATAWANVGRETNDGQTNNVVKEFIVRR